MFIAQAVPSPIVTSNEQAVFFFLLAGSLAFLLWCGVSVITIITSLRRKPSIDAEFATKNDMRQAALDRQAALSDLRSEMHRELGKIEGATNKIFEKIDHLSAAITRSFGDVQRDIGRLEGNQKSLPCRAGEEVP